MDTRLKFSMLDTDSGRMLKRLPCMRAVLQAKRPSPTVEVAQFTVSLLTVCCCTKSMCVFHLLVEECPHAGANLMRSECMLDS